MKAFTYIFLTASALMIILNITKLDFNNLFAGDSLIAIISILALACGITLILILNKAKKVVSKSR
ncbi:MAG TPA: hypothetical protein VKX30_05750 [Flavobacteriaceae bacterium]|nr:hypothetical protein [Flavobacteriaceae bacterium]